MTDKQTPPDWVLIEAAKRSDWYVTNCGAQLRPAYKTNHAFRALCDMIQKYEQPPADPKTVCVREAYRFYEREWGSKFTGTKQQIIWIGERAIELWEEGFGRD